MFNTKMNYSNLWVKLRVKMICGVNPPAVVVAAQPPLSVGVLQGVVRVLEGLVPEETGFPSMQAGLVLEAPVVLSVGSVALCKEKHEMEKDEET